MSHRRELTKAQANLIEAVRRYIDESNYETWSALLDARDEYERVAADLDAAGAASARPTSIAAGKSKLPAKGSLRRGIVTTLVATELEFGAGLTCDQLGVRLRAKHHGTVSSAVNFLEQTGWIRDSGETRDTRSGSPAIVWRPTQRAVDHVKEATLT